MKKSYIILLISVIAFGIVFFVFIGLPELEKRKNYQKNMNIVIGYDTFWSYDSEKKWYTDDKKIVYGNKEYNVYINNIYKGKYDIDLSNDKWYYFDKNKDSIKFEGNLFAYNGKRKLSLIEYSVDDMSQSDLESISTLNDKIDFSVIKISDLTLNQKVAIDVDDDGELEYIYALSNFFCENCYYNKKYYSYAFIVDGKKLTLLNSFIGESPYSGYLYNIGYLIDLDNNNNLEVILSKSIPGNNIVYHEMYFRVKNKYKKVIGSGG